MADLEHKTVTRLGVKLFLYRPLTAKAWEALSDFKPREDGFYGFGMPMKWYGLTVKELPEEP